VLPSPPSPPANGAPNSVASSEGEDGAHSLTGARTEAFDAFRTGELVEVFTDSVRALARVREVSEAGRLHIAFEMGEYLPWVDGAVLIRLAATPTSGESGARVGGRGCAARILHAGTSTALLQVLGAVGAVEELPPAREPFDTLPLLDQ
jgi:hypothetical protein